MIHRLETTISGQTLSIESGRVAEQAGGAVLVRYGDTVVLGTATASKTPREGIDFFPLTVDIEERQYAAGRIPGGFIKREGRPTEHSILAARLADRPIRPLFPKGYRNDVQVVITVLSADRENDPDVLGIIAASAALTISDIPFAGPVGAVRVGYTDGQVVINPAESTLDQSLLDLVVAGTADAVVMVEAGAKELPEETMVEAIRAGHDAIQAIIAIQLQLAEVAGKPKQAFMPQQIDPDLARTVSEFVRPRFDEAVNNPNKAEREGRLHAVEAALVQDLAPRYPEALRDIRALFEQELKRYVRTQILERRVRPDGRGPKDIRPISCEVGFLPRPHGSAIFTRGQTQVLSVVTLGSPGEEQRLDGLGAEETKRYIHHYNFPAFSVGETRTSRGPGRREIGHGALAERALLPVIPGDSEFPYTIRVVSEVLSSNGSTSMGSTCGSTLALMDAGVPISAPVSGVAMGLITASDTITPGNYMILTDIQGIEDALGDMDFKVAGSADGVTALQMDIKVKGLTAEVLAQAMAQAREGRMYIMDKMLEVLPEPRMELSLYAPRIQTMRVSTDKIGAIIGPGGKTVRRIQDETGAKIEIDDDGTVHISSVSEEGMTRALNAVRALSEEVEVGKIYTGVVRRLVDFGAFVEILPGKEGLVRLSQLADYHVNRPEDVVAVGDEITVMVIEMDPQGRINLSRRAALSGEMPSAEEMEAEHASRGPSRGPRSGPGGGSYGGGSYSSPRGGFGDRGGAGGYSRGGPGGGRGGPGGSRGPGGRSFDRGGPGGV